MLALGRALMAQPVLLMLDEPSLGLAPLIVREIFRIVASLRACRRIDPVGRAERPRCAGDRRLRLCARNGRDYLPRSGFGPGPRPPRERDLSRRIGVMARSGYTDVVLAAPVTVPYVRYSIAARIGLLGRALAQLRRGRRHREGDGSTGCASPASRWIPIPRSGSPSILGLSPRWLDNIPMGGACGVIALRRAARAVQAGDAEIVACIAGDTNQRDSFPATCWRPSAVSRGMRCILMARAARMRASR